MDNKTFLIVDDSDAEQFLCQHLIDSTFKDVNVISAANGVEALDLLADGTLQPDYILLDINMPCMTGFEFLDVYQNKCVGKKTHIAMFSSTVDKKEKDKALSYESVSYFFEKPLSKEHLLTLSGNPSKPS